MEKYGYNPDLDVFVDELVKELKVVLEKSKLPNSLKIEIILE